MGFSFDRDEVKRALTIDQNEPSDDDVQAECNHLDGLFNGPLLGKLDAYADFHVEGAGGSGFVFRALYKPYQTLRAIKVPRRATYQQELADRPLIDPELDALSKLSHQNLIRLYDSFPLERPNTFCMVTAYVDNKKPLDEFAAGLCCSAACRKSDLVRSSCLRQLANVIYQLSEALVYLHEQAKLLHFDVKPDNVLVSGAGIPYVTDLGFARDMTKYSEAKEVEVGFTWKYAHPALTDPHTGARVSKTPAKSKNRIPPSHLTPKIDVFAFGRTIQECLKGLENVYGESVYSDYAYNYLHLVAALCLDGRNAVRTEAPPDPSFAFVSDQPSGISIDVLKAHRFRGFGEIRTALQRLLGLRRVEDEVPELDVWGSSSVNVSDFGITTFTPRVKALVEHPLVSHLRGEYQLGMLDSVFPTATHSRFQHSLGVYHSARTYISALYYDPENPTFRALFTPERCRVTLAAALIHDIGHSSLGHELEEVDKVVFSHLDIGRVLLQSGNVRDAAGRTVKQLLESSEPEGWLVPADDVLKMLRGESRKPVDAVFHEILDSQVDADKLDYLLRDSTECRVQYGHGIDHARFVRSLTTFAEKGSSTIRLAIKQKGAASADAFAFARYQLYQSLYWHHTVRAIKSMFMTAAVLALPKKTGLFDPQTILDAYLQQVFGIQVSREVESSSGKSRKKNQPTIESKMSQFCPLVNTNHPVDRLLAFFWRLAPPKGQRLLEDLSARTFYKRLAEIPLAKASSAEFFSLREQIAAKREDLNNSVNEKLISLMRTAIQGQSQIRQSLVIDEALERFESRCNEKIPFLSDMPSSGWPSGEDAPIFVSDYKRRHFRADSARQAAEPSSLWGEMMFSLMKGVATFRVYAEPEIHRIATRVLTPKEILGALKEAVPQLKHVIGLEEKAAS